MRVSSKVLQAVIAPASVSDVRLLRLPGEHPMIYDITRLRYIENRPLSLERSHLPAYLFPLFLTRDLTTPFYTMFERDYGVYPCNVDETLESVVGDEQENELLQIEAGTPLMRIHHASFRLCTPVRNVYAEYDEISRKILRLYDAAVGGPAGEFGAV